MPLDVIATTRTVLECPNGKRVTQRVQPRNWLAPGAIQTKATYELQEDVVDSVVAELASAAVHKQMVIGIGQPPSPSEITIETFDGCLMEWDQPTLTELRLADKQTIRCEIVEAQGQRLGDAETSRNQEGEEGAVCMRA
jgi:hypothetical protein